MAVGDVYRLAIEGTPNDVDTFANILHYRQTLTQLPGLTSAESLIEAFVADAMPAYQAIMYEGFAFKACRVAQVTGGAEVAEEALTLFGTGAASGEFLPYQSAAIISWRTGQAGRSKRGRSYLFTPLEGDQVGGNLSAGYISLMDDIVAAWQSITHPTNLAEFELVVWSATLLSAQVVTAGISRGLIGTQRSRRSGSGS